MAYDSIRGNRNHDRLGLKVKNVPYLPVAYEKCCAACDRLFHSPMYALRAGELLGTLSTRP
jgi:hypothetical protein